MSGATEILAHFGVAPERLKNETQSLSQHLPLVAAHLSEWLADAPDPVLALANWERLRDETPDPRVLEGWSAADWRPLLTLLGSSQSLANTLHGAGSAWPQVFREARTAPRRQEAEHLAALEGVFPAPWEEFESALRRYKHREYLRIGLADLTGDYPVETTVAEVSALAAGLCDAAYHWARARLRDDFGELVGEDGSPLGFTAMGMGKLGGGELNFSSDVDLVYVYESDTGHSLGGRRGKIEPRAYFTRLAELMTRALQEATASGFAFRVDLRLRPDGMNGPIANSVANAVLYYESYGQTWERTALLPARPVAGSRQLGEAFLREMRPFVYRSYLDFSTVADMKAMKDRIESQLGGKAGRDNLKLGRGGIREIEFLAQVFQVIHGGRDERVRVRGTLPTLQRLVECRYLPADEGRALSEAYRYLRNVEHKIQIVHQRQTHSLPSDPREQETLARRLGYRQADASGQFLADLHRHTELVRRTFEKLFHEPAAETRRSGDEATVQLVHHLDDRDASLTLLKQLGFQRPEASYENLTLLRDGPSSAPARPRRRQVLYELAPALLAAIRDSPDPDLALENLATFVSSVGARTSFLLLLRENPGTLRMLVELFGTSQFLANAFIRRPELLDSLVRADLVRVRRPLADLMAELHSLVAAAEGFEGALEAMRRFRNQEFLRIGINDVQGLLEPEEVVCELATLAESCLREAMGVASAEVCKRLGVPSLPGQIVVLAVGKLGGGELNYNSDLDLIFVYRESSDEHLGSVAHEQFTRFVQQLLTVLQAPTREGIVYRIDTRLRPSGRSGPLVSSLEGFQKYHEQSAQVWERQALIKARAVAGANELASVVEDVVTQFVYRSPLTIEEAREIRRLRGRMERELARESDRRLNIKTGRGGLVDVEFVTQMLQLHYGAKDPQVRSRNTLEALRLLEAAGVLSAADHTILSDGYRFLRRVENALRLAHDRPVEDLDREDIDLGLVARRLSFPGPAHRAAGLLWEEYKRRREAIRSCYDKWFDRADQGFA